MSAAVHSFTASLAESHRVEDLPFWGQVYREAFPDVVGVHRHRANGEHQKAGIDASIVLANSKQILVDEKYRRKDYGDILLERWSDYARREPGWIVKPLRADFIAYAVLPAGRLYLLPVLPLQAAWRRHGREWMAGEPIDAANEEDGRTWTTRSWAIAPDVLFRAMGEAYSYAAVGA